MKKSSIPMIMIWALYSLGAGIFLFLTAMSASSALGFGTVPGLVAGFVVMLFLGLFVRGIAAVVQRRPAGERKRPRSLSSFAENVFLLLSLAGMTVLRLSIPWDTAADPVFEMAKVSEESFAPAVSHGGMAIYLRLLHGAMLLLGNKAFSAVVLQVFLLICAAFSMYCGVKKFSGTAEALVTVVFMGFAPYMLVETRRLTPLLLFLIVYGMSMGCMAALPERMHGTGDISGNVSAVLHYLATGLLIGLCCYVDCTGITLLIFLTEIICLENTQKTEERDTGILGNGILVFVCCVLAALIGYLLSHGIFRLGGGSLADSIRSQMALCLPGDFCIPMTVSAEAAFWDVPVLAALMCVGVFSFWYRGRIRDKATWFFAAGLLVLMQCFGMDSVEYINSYVLLYLFCTGMAGSSIADLLTWEDKQKQPGAAGTDSSQGEITDMSMNAEKIETPQKEDGLKYEGLGTEQQPVINYIENPLPLPKKKAHKVLDYDYEVADDDDFDIQ